MGLNSVKGLEKIKMVDVIHKGGTTSQMINKAMPILQELNLRVADWSMVPPLYDIWIYYRSQVKEIIKEFGIMYLPKYPLLPHELTSPIFGIPSIQRCTGGLSHGILREAVQQVISVPYDQSSIRYLKKIRLGMRISRLRSDSKEFTGMPATPKGT